jgi:hypothetical protein
VEETPPLFNKERTADIPIPLHRYCTLKKTSFSEFLISYEEAKQEKERECQKLGVDGYSR